MSRKHISVLAVAPLALVVFAASQCGKTDLDAKLRFQVPPVPRAEETVYRILARGDSIGLYRAMLRLGLFKEVPAFQLTLVTNTVSGDIEVSDSSVVFVAQDSLAPLSSFRFVRTGNAMVTTAANYGQGSVAVSTFSGGEEHQKLLPSESRTFDVDQLTFLARSLRLDPKKPTEIKVVNPMGPPKGGSVRPAALRVGGDEIITVPAGTFDCRKVALEVDERQVELWYEKAGTQRLIRYSAQASGVIMELLPPTESEPEAEPE